MGLGPQQLEFSVKLFFYFHPHPKPTHSGKNLGLTRQQIKKIYDTNFILNVILYRVSKFEADRMTLSKVMGEEAQISGCGIHAKVAILRVNEKFVVGQFGSK